MFGSLLYELANIATLGVLDDVADAALKTAAKSEADKAMDLYIKLINSGHTRDEALKLVKVRFHV